MDKRKRRIVPPNRKSFDQNEKQEASYGTISFPKSEVKDHLSSCKLQIDDIQHHHTVL